MEAEETSASSSSPADKPTSSNVCTADLQRIETHVRSGIWSRQLARTWTLMLLLVTCLLHWARMAMPICAVTMAEQFGWSKTESGLVLGTFFWGYCFTQVLGGHASDKIGGERVLLLSTSSWAVVTAGTPLLADLGLSPLITMMLARFLMGVLQGVHYPSLTSICAQRVSEGERGFLTSTLGCGCYLGMLMVGGVGSIMLEWYGWESVFYIPGIFSAFWAICVWRFLIRGPTITFESLWSTSVSASPAKPFKTWLHLFKQPCVWALVFTHLCYSSTYFTLMSWLPTFFKDTYPHAKGWVFNVVPWFVAMPSSLFGGTISDHLIREGYETVTVRKGMQFCSMGLSSVFTLLLCKTTVFFEAVAFVSAYIGLSTFHNSGVSVNVHDLAPSCAGALFGIMNTCAAFTGLLMVYITGYLIEITGSWATVFTLLSLVNFVGIAFFLLFGEAKRIDQADESQVITI